MSRVIRYAVTAAGISGFGLIAVSGLSFTLPGQVHAVYAANTMTLTPPVQQHSAQPKPPVVVQQPADTVAAAQQVAGISRHHAVVVMIRKRHQHWLAHKHHLALLAEQKAAAVAAAQQQATTTPTPAPGTPAPAVGTPTPSPSVAAPVASSSGDAAASALGVCIRTREEGGSYAWGPGNGGGAYQFQIGTWETYGGAASEYGVAGPAYQDQIFDNAIAAGGSGNWTPYDGC